MLKIIKKKSKLFFLLAVIIFSLPSVLSLIHAGFPLTDDGNWMVIRFSAFYENLRNGQFPVRFLTRLNNGFGYPVADFLYPLFMYIGVPIHIIGINFVNTIKVILGLSLIVSSVFAFLWLKKLFDNLSAFLGALLYLYFPYHLYDVYKRGSVGETLSLAIVPFVLWQIERKNILFTSLGITLLILSHNTLALLFIPLIFIYSLLRNKNLFKFILISFIFGIGSSAFFSIPAIYDTRYTVFSNTQISDFSNYFINSGNFEIIGVITPILLFVLLIYIFLNKKATRDKLFVFSLASALVTLFFTLPLSKSFWEIIPLTNLIQFPFRLLSILIVIFSFQLAFLISKLKGKSKIIIIVIFLILLVISAKPYLSVNNYQYHPDSFYSTNQDTTTVKNEYMPKWVKDTNLKFTTTRVENLTGKEVINVSYVTPNRISFNTYLVSERKIQVNLVYFPGWNAYVNGVRQKIDYEKNGLIILNLNKGQNNVRVIFEETQIRILSNFLSIISIVTLFIFYILLKNNRLKFKI